MAVYRTRDGGGVWKRVTPWKAFCAEPRTCVTGLRFATSRIGYLYGPASFMTVDGGRTWTPLPGRHVESLASAGGSVFRLVYPGSGCPGPCQPALQRAAPGSSAWRTVRRWPLGLGGFGEQLITGGTNVYVVFYGHVAGGALSAHARIAVSRDLGRTWATRTDPCGGSGAEEHDAIAAAAAGNLLAVLCVHRSGQATAFAALSRDGGMTFTRGTRVPVRGPQQVSVARDGTIAVGNGGMGGSGRFAYQLALSGDGGRTWRVAVRDREPLTENLAVTPLQLVGARTVSWVGSPYRLWQSSDGGRTWRNSPAP